MLILKESLLLDIPKDDKDLLLELLNEKNIPEQLVEELVLKAMEVRYKTRAIGFKSDILNLIEDFSKKELS